MQRVAVSEERVECEEPLSGWRGFLVVGTADRGKSENGCVRADHDGDGWRRRWGWGIEGAD